MASVDEFDGLNTLHNLPDGRGFEKHSAARAVENLAAPSDSVTERPWCSLATERTVAGSSRKQEGLRKLECFFWLVFILEPGWQPSEIYSGPADEVEGLDAWRDVFMKELKEDFSGFSRLRQALKDSVESLDQGKSYVYEGYDWLYEELFGYPLDTRSSDGE